MRSAAQVSTRYAIKKTTMAAKVTVHATSTENNLKSQFVTRNMGFAIPFCNGVGKHRVKHMVELVCRSQDMSRKLYPANNKEVNYSF